MGLGTGIIKYRSSLPDRDPARRSEHELFGFKIKESKAVQFWIIKNLKKISNKDIGIGLIL